MWPTDPTEFFYMTDFFAVFFVLPFLCFYLAEREQVGVSDTSHVSCSPISHFAVEMDQLLTFWGLQRTESIWESESVNKIWKKKIESLVEIFFWNLPGMLRMLISPNTTPSPRVTNTWEYKYNYDKHLRMKIQKQLLSMDDKLRIGSFLLNIGSFEKLFLI